MGNNIRVPCAIAIWCGGGGPLGGPRLVLRREVLRRSAVARSVREISLQSACAVVSIPRVLPQRGLLLAIQERLQLFRRVAFVSSDSALLFQDESLEFEAIVGSFCCEFSTADAAGSRRVVTSFCGCLSCRGRQLLCCSTSGGRRQSVTMLLVSWAFIWSISRST